MVSQALDTLVFVTIAFWGQFPLPVLAEIFVTTYAIKWLVAVFDTPFMYAAKYLYQKGLAGQED
jgi:uncharacterized integral membrane protein (TIGR00697 family)